MQVTSTFLMKSLAAEYSESGSTKRLQETAVMAYFNQYVEEREESCEYHVSANLNQNFHNNWKVHYVGNTRYSGML